MTIKSTIPMTIGMITSANLGEPLPEHRALGANEIRHSRILLNILSIFTQYSGCSDKLMFY